MEPMKWKTDTSTAHGDAGGVRLPAADRRSVLADVRRQSEDASVEAAVRAALNCFPHDVDLTVSSLGDIDANGVGSLSISITAVAKDPVKEAARVEEAAQAAADAKQAERDDRAEHKAQAERDRFNAGSGEGSTRGGPGPGPTF